jgi:hypothetical protein
VRLAAADHHGDDAHAVASRDAETTAAVVEAAVRTAQRLRQRHEDPGGQVVVVLAFDRVERLAGRADEVLAGAGDLGQQEEASLRARLGPGGRLVEGEKVERIRRPFVGGRKSDPGRETVAHGRRGAARAVRVARLYGRLSRLLDPPIRPGRAPRWSPPGGPSCARSRPTRGRRVAGTAPGRASDRMPRRGPFPR